MKGNDPFPMLGMAQRAGKIASGETAAENAIKGGKAFLVLVAEDASENTKKKFENMCRYRRIPYCFYGTKKAIGAALGKDERASLAVTDQAFASGISMRMQPKI